MLLDLSFFIIVKHFWHVVHHCKSLRYLLVIRPSLITSLLSFFLIQLFRFHSQVIAIPKKREVRAFFGFRENLTGEREWGVGSRE